MIMPPLLTKLDGRHRKPLLASSSTLTSSSSRRQQQQHQQPQQEDDGCLRCRKRGAGSNFDDDDDKSKTSSSHDKHESGGGENRVVAAAAVKKEISVNCCSKGAGAVGVVVVVGVCAMAKKSESKAMREILTRLEHKFENIKTTIFPQETILQAPVEKWPLCDCLIAFHSKGFPLEKAISYVKLRQPFLINSLETQYLIQDRRKVYEILNRERIPIPRYAVVDNSSSSSSSSFSCDSSTSSSSSSPSSRNNHLTENPNHVTVHDGVTTTTFHKPFVEKPVSAEDHNVYIYYPPCTGGGSQRLFRKVRGWCSIHSCESHVRQSGCYIYEDYIPTNGMDVKVYTVGPDYAHAEARKSPALDGKVERDMEGNERRYPVMLTQVEKLIARKICLAFKQTICGFDLLRGTDGRSYVCDVNGFSFVKNSAKYYEDCASILGNMILRELGAGTKKEQMLEC